MYIILLCLICHQQIQAYEDAMRQQRLSGWVSVTFKAAFTNPSDCTLCVVPESVFRKRSYMRLGSICKQEQVNPNQYFTDSLAK